MKYLDPGVVEANFFASMAAYIGVEGREEAPPFMATLFDE